MAWVSFKVRSAIHRALLWGQARARTSGFPPKKNAARRRRGLWIKTCRLDDVCLQITIGEQGLNDGLLTTPTGHQVDILQQNTLSVSARR